MRLFQPHKIGKLALKNRIVMAPMAIGGLVEPDGRFGEQAIAYYRERARGGTGLIITGINTVECRVESHLLNGWAAAFPRLDSGVYVPRLSKLADSVHDYGARVALQLTAGFGRVAPRFLLRGGRAIAPSAVPCFWDSRVTAQELTRAEIAELIKAFGAAARIAQAAGIDAVELHGHEGYLLDQFKTGLWNRRRDSYGGNLEGRLRFSREVIQSIKKAAGTDFPVIYRYGLTHDLPGGREIEEGLEIGRLLESYGADALHVDAGCYENWYWAHPPLYMDRGCMVEMAARVKQAVRIPVIAVGRLGYPELAERVLSEGKADFIALGRALLADPEWPRKVQEERADQIRPCVGDHDGCLGRSFKGKPLSCTVNPTVGLEDELALIPAARPLSILVIGGGPAGMEAARVAALRGHSVALWEKQDRLGGNLIPASVPKFKEDVAGLRRYFSAQMERLGVAVRLGEAATAARVLEAKADAVILATGSAPIIPDVPGVRQNNVVSAIDLLGGAESPGAGEAVVIGGGFLGCETAVHLAQQGKKITLVEALPQILEDMFLANRQYLLKMIRENQIHVLTGRSLMAIQGEKVFLSCGEGETEEVEAQMVVLAVGMRPRQELQSALEGKIPRLHAIGDCVEPRRIFEAIWEAYRLARLL